MKSVVFGAAMLLCATASAIAYEDTGFRPIQGFGCQMDNNQCYIELGVAVGGTYGCNQQSIRWDGANGTNAKAVNAIVLTALSLGKQVQVVIGGCYQGWPTPAFIRIQP